MVDWMKYSKIWIAEESSRVENPHKTCLNLFSPFKNYSTVYVVTILRNISSISNTNKVLSYNKKNTRDKKIYAENWSEGFFHNNKLIKMYHKSIAKLNLKFDKIRDSLWIGVFFPHYISKKRSFTGQTCFCFAEYL